MVLIFLTCKNKKEAAAIATALLEKKLVACTKILSTDSKYLWKSRIEKAEEALLLLETYEEKFESIEKVVRKLHSYKTFVMFATPVVKTVGEVDKWLRSELT